MDKASRAKFVKSYKKALVATSDKMSVVFLVMDMYKTYNVKKMEPKSS